MKCKTVWKGGMLFKGKAGKHTVSMDAPQPLGHDHGAAPKELLVMALCGCTGMDVVGLLKKNKQTIDGFEVAAYVESTEGMYPIVFEFIELTFKLDGDIDEELAITAVQLSEKRYCGVSAMLSQAFPIRWKIVLNGREVRLGESELGLSLE